MRIIHWQAVLGAAALALGFATAAPAGTITWDLTYMGPGILTQGTLTTSSTVNGQGAYTITGIDLIRNGVVTTQLLSTDANYDDNLLFTNGPIVDQYGLGFEIGSIPYDFYYNGTSACGTLGYREDNGAAFPYCSSVAPVLTSVTLNKAVPEPLSLGLMMLGITGLGLFRRRRPR